METMNAQKLVVPMPEARQVLGGIGHTMLYELINRGEILKVNIGRRSWALCTPLPGESLVGNTGSG